VSGEEGRGWLGREPLGGEGLGKGTGEGPGKGTGEGPGKAAGEASRRRPGGAEQPLIPGARRAPVRRVGRRPTEPEAAKAAEALAQGGTDEVAHVAVFSAEPADPAAQDRAEKVIALLFLLSALGTIGFCSIWFFTHVSGSNLRHLLLINTTMGLAMAAMLGGLGAGFVVWAKHLMPHVKFVQSREELHSKPEDQLAAEQVVLDGVTGTGIGRRSLIKRTMALAFGLLPLPALFALRDLGPRPLDSLRRTAWKAGDRLVDMDSRRPVRLGDLPIGGFMTVMPEGFTSAVDEALSPTLLIRLGPGENRPLPGRQNWAPADHVAYSKICTHAGCPVGLYEQQTHVLLCPCHQSTFLATEGAKVIFGPAARNLPQLPIYIDSQGYFRARSAYLEPCGPSFWERGSVPT
jgi:ubiquinol-cytochrome c reductase iron-sulfur subunit